MDTLLRSQPAILALVTLIAGILWWAVRSYLRQTIEAHVVVVRDTVERSLATVPTQQSVDVLRDRADAIGLRVASLEAMMPHLPRVEQINELALSLATLRGEVGRIGDGVNSMEKLMTPMAARITRMEDHMLDGARP